MDNEIIKNVKVKGHFLKNISFNLGEDGEVWLRIWPQQVLLHKEKKNDEKVKVEQSGKMFSPDIHVVFNKHGTNMFRQFNKYSSP